jgi:response regulator RpfG family c-di-GMP phosphodiesterase
MQNVLRIGLEPSLARSLAERMAHDGVQFIDCDTGSEGLVHAQQAGVSLVLAGDPLADLRGQDLVAQLKDDPFTRNVPVVVVADSANPAARHEALSAGALDYFLPPVHVEELAVRIRWGLWERALESKLELRNSMMYQLHNFSLQLNQLESVEETLRTTLIISLSLTGSARGAILIPDRTTRALQVAHSVGTRDAGAETVTFDVDGSISGDVFRRGREFIAVHDEDWPRARMVDRELLGEPPVLVLPIRTDTGPVGVLVLGGKRSTTGYDEQDARVLKCVAASAAVATESQQRRFHLDRTRDAALLGLAALAESRDRETGDHLERLRAYCAILAKGLRSYRRYASVISPDFLETLWRSVPLHDIGKVGIPDHILLKPDKLTEEEYVIMKRHAAIGAEVLESMSEKVGVDSFLTMARDIARHHHERYDGTGYPDGLAGEAIPVSARIAALADVYDALTADRVYRKAMPHARAVEIIVDARGSHFDPDVADVFRRLHGEFDALRRALSQGAAPPSTPERALVGSVAP